MPFQFRINLDSELKRLLGEYELIIPSCVTRELTGLRCDEKIGAKALALARSKPAPEWYLELESKLFPGQTNSKPKEDTGAPGGSQVDNEILQIAKSINAIVVTNDRAFLKLLRSHGVRTISMRGKKYLQLDQV